MRKCSKFDFFLELLFICFLKIISIFLNKLPYIRVNFQHLESITIYISRSELFNIILIELRQSGKWTTSLKKMTTLPTNTHNFILNHVSFVPDAWSMYLSTNMKFIMKNVYSINMFSITSKQNHLSTSISILIYVIFQLWEIMSGRQMKKQPETTHLNSTIDRVQEKNVAFVEWKLLMAIRYHVSTYSVGNVWRSGQL